MQYIKPLFLLLVISLLPTVSYGKPLPSISVEAKWQNGIAYETPIVLKVNVFSYVTSDNMQLKLIVPEGVSVLDGQKKMRVSIEKSKVIEKLFTLQIPKNTIGKIKVEARIRYGDSSSFYSAAVLPIQQSRVLNKLSASNKKEKFRRIERNGEWLRDYQIQ